MTASMPACAPVSVATMPCCRSMDMARGSAIAVRWSFRQRASMAWNCRASSGSASHMLADAKIGSRYAHCTCAASHASSAVCTAVSVASHAAMRREKDEA